MQPFRPRSIAPLRVMSHGDWRIKLYSVALDGSLVDEERFTQGLALALASLPEPARSAGRIGAAFCIFHQARGIDYAVLAWWDRENEMPLRVFVHEDGETHWRPSRGSESVCVWDLQVIGYERDLYVDTILADPPHPTGAYLASALNAERRSAAPSANESD